MSTPTPATAYRHDGNEQGATKLTRWVLEHGGDVLDRDGLAVVVASTWGPQTVRPSDWIVKERGTFAKYGPRMMATRQDK